MTSSEIKSIKQAEALIAVKGAGGIGAVAMATGTGKSKIGIDWAVQINSMMSGNFKVLLVVPTEKLRDVNWKDEFTKWGCSHIYDNNVETICYASLHTVAGRDYDLIILDEYHNITPNSGFNLDQLTYDRLLALSATEPKDPVKKDVLKHLGIKVVYRITLDEAVELGLISPYKITVVELSLNDVDKTIKAGSKDKPFMQTEKGMYDYLNKIVNAAIYGSDMKLKAGLKFHLLKRMRFLYDLPSKTSAAKQIISMIPKGLRTLIFCGGIPQADELCEYSFHSKSKSDKHFNDFRSGAIDMMSCVNSVNEGHNIDEGVDVALIVQLNSNEKDLVQRIGRIVRYADDHVGHVIILTVVDIKDEDWMRKATESFDASNIKFIRYPNLISGNTKLFDD